MDNIFFNKDCLTSFEDFDVLEVSDSTIIIMRNGLVDFMPLTDFKTVRTKDDAYIIEHLSINEIRTQLLDYLLNKELSGNERELITVNNDTKQIEIYNYEGELEFTINYNDGSHELNNTSCRVKFKPDPDEEFRYCCIQPKSFNIDHKIVTTDIGKITVENIVILALLKTKFMLRVMFDMDFKSGNDGAIKSQFSGNKYGKYLRY